MKHYKPTSAKLAAKYAEGAAELQLQVKQHKHKMYPDLYVTTSKAVQKLAAGVRLGFVQDLDQVAEAGSNDVDFCRGCSVLVKVQDQDNPSDVPAQRIFYLRLCGEKVTGGWSEKLFDEHTEERIGGWKRCTKCMNFMEKSVIAELNPRPDTIPPAPLLRLQGCGTCWLEFTWKGKRNFFDIGAVHLQGTTKVSTPVRVMDRTIRVSGGTYQVAERPIVVEPESKSPPLVAVTDSQVPPEAKKTTHTQCTECQVRAPSLPHSDAFCCTG
eukprot:1733422-Rhodomonas_salina.1